MKKKYASFVWAATSLLAILLASPAFADTNGSEDANRNKFTFALWGGMPYFKPGEPDTQTPEIVPLIADINAAKVAFTVFDGDICQSAPNSFHLSASNCFHFFGLLRTIFALLKGVGIVTCFQNIAMMGNAVK